MTSTTITLKVKLTISSDETLTENDKGQIVSDMDYNFLFNEMLNGNLVMIADTEIVDIIG